MSCRLRVCKSCGSLSKVSLGRIAFISASSYPNCTLEPPNFLAIMNQPPLFFDSPSLQQNRFLFSIQGGRNGGVPVVQKNFAQKFSNLRTSYPVASFVPRFLSCWSNESGFPISDREGLSNCKDLSSTQWSSAKRSHVRHVQPRSNFIGSAIPHQTYPQYKLSILYVQVDKYQLWKETLSCCVLRS